MVVLGEASFGLSKEEPSLGKFFWDIFSRFSKESFSVEAYCLVGVGASVTEGVFSPAIDCSTDFFS